MEEDVCLEVLQWGGYKTPCGFCRGDGKTDWIQIETNEPKIQQLPREYTNYLNKNIEEYMALCIAQEIDTEILKSLITSGMEPKGMCLQMMK